MLYPVIFMAAFGLEGHTTFLRPLDYSGNPGEERSIFVFNGTFEESVDSIPAERVAKIFVLGPNGKTFQGEPNWIRGKVGSALWRAWQRIKPIIGGMDQRRTSTVSYTPSETGTYMLGFSLHEARVAMNPDTFNSYLEEVGLADEPIAMHGFNDPNKIIRERYTKSAKTVFQAGEEFTDSILEPVGFGAEIIPLQNPFFLENQDTLTVQLLLNGDPLPGQVLLVGRQGGLKDEPTGHMQLRSGPDGKVDIPIVNDGEWWLEFNHMLKAAEADEVDYVTFWTTLTFEI